MSRTPEELKRLIEEETAKIKQLEASFPLLGDPKNRYSPANREYNIHETELRDAFWRRRMWQSHLDGTDLNATAAVY